MARDPVQLSAGCGGVRSGMGSGRGDSRLSCGLGTAAAVGTGACPTPSPPPGFFWVVLGWFEGGVSTCEAWQGRRGASDGRSQALPLFNPLPWLLTLFLRPASPPSSACLRTWWPGVAQESAPPRGSACLLAKIILRFFSCRFPCFPLGLSSNSPLQ